MKTKKALCYGDYQSKSDKWLNKQSGVLYFKIKDKLPQDLWHTLDELCEVERELTLREEQPY